MNRMGRLRVAVSRIDDKELRSIISTLNRQDLGRLHPAERSALRSLRSSHNPAQSILQPHYAPALPSVAEVLSHDCLEATREALGDAADEPTLEQLKTALATVHEQFPAPMVALMLAVTAASDAPAADICNQVLDQDEELGLQEIEEPAAPAPVGRAARTPRPPKVKAQKQPKDTHKPWKNAKDTGEAGPAEEPAAGTARPVEQSVSRRPAHLPARYSDTFDPGDPLSGAVVIAEIPFDADDQPSGSKLRPCVVVAGSPTALVVRAGYTGRYQSGSWRSTELVHWRQAGLKKATHIEAEFREIDREGIELVGRLAEEDWNSLW